MEKLYGLSVLKKRVVNILSGGIDPKGDLPDYVCSRVNYVVSNQTDFDAVLISSRYSRNIPLKSNEIGLPQYENETISKSLIHMGITLPIFLESASTDTVGSAIFARLYLSQLYDAFDLHVVTSGFHYERTKCIYDWVFALPGMSYVPAINVISADNNPGTAARQLREKKHLEFFKDTWMNINSFEGAFRNMLSNHDDYSGLTPERALALDANY